MRKSLGSRLAWACLTCLSCIWQNTKSLVTSNALSNLRLLLVIIIITTGIYIVAFIIRLKALYKTLRGTLPDCFFTGANCGHAVYNLIMITVGFTGAPKTEQSNRPSHRGLRPLLFFEQCVGSLTSHTSTVRRDLRFIVLIREDYKV